MIIMEMELYRIITLSKIIALTYVCLVSTSRNEKYNTCNAFLNSTVTLPKSKSLQGISECKTIDEILCMKMYFETYYHEAQEICPRHCTVIEYDGKLSYKY